MAIKFDGTKNAQAVEIIANKIASIPANTPMAHGTFGASIGHTKREGEAKSMAHYFCKRMYGWEIKDLTEMTADEVDMLKVMSDITAQAIAKVGK